AEVASRHELVSTRERIDAEARAADAAALREQALEIDHLRAELEAAGTCAHEAEIAALRAAFDERGAEVAGLQAALEERAAEAAAAGAVRGGLGGGGAEAAGLQGALEERGAEAAAVQAKLEAELGHQVEAFAEQAAMQDELDRLRRYCAAFEQESVRAAALET